MSLFIPAVFKNVSAERIISAFEKVGLGKVSKVNFIDRNEKFNSVHIIFSNWRNTESVYNFQKKAKSHQGAKLVYDDPWHWIVLEYRPKVEKNMPQKHYKKYIEVPLNYVTDLESENNNLKYELHHITKMYTNKIQKLEKQLARMETELKENDHHSKIYIDEILCLKQKIVTIEEGEEDERKAH